MILESAGAPMEASSGTEGEVRAPQIPSHGPAGEQAQAGRQEAAVQLERDYPGYHVWTSDGGWWYATRTHSWRRGRSATVHAPGPEELAAALAAEQAAMIGCAMTGAW